MHGFRFEAAGDRLSASWLKRRSRLWRPPDADVLWARAARLIPFAALVVGAVAIGVSPISVRLADVGPFASAFWRVTLALPLLWAWARLADGPGRPPRRFEPATILTGLTFAGTLLFWHPSVTPGIRASRTRRFSQRPRRSGWCSSAGSYSAGA